MALGFGITTFINKLLDHIRGGTAYTQPSGLYVKLHLGDPGAAGTANPSAVTTRSQATFAAASGGAMGLTGTLPSFTMTTGETVTHISVWDASTSGNFLWSIALSASKIVVATDVLTLNTLGVAFAPLAA